MPAYWVRFLNAQGRIMSSEKMICADDEEVVEKVRAIVVAEHRNGFEIWAGDRLVDVENVRQPC
jgi:hypothetical protein